MKVSLARSQRRQMGLDQRTHHPPRKRGCCRARGRFHKAQILRHLRFCWFRACHAGKNMSTGASQSLVGEYIKVISVVSQQQRGNCFISAEVCVHAFRVFVLVPTDLHRTTELKWVNILTLRAAMFSRNLAVLEFFTCPNKSCVSA